MYIYGGNGGGKETAGRQEEFYLNRDILRISPRNERGEKSPRGNI